MRPVITLTESNTDGPATFAARRSGVARGLIFLFPWGPYDGLRYGLRRRTAPANQVVKYRTALATRDLATNAARAMVEATSRHGVTMSASRRMHNGANVMTLDREMPEQEYLQLVSEIAASDNVEYAEPDRMLKATLTPNDTYYNLQWHYYEPTGSINVPTA